jgi:hypothetical protein
MAWWSPCQKLQSCLPHVSEFYLNTGLPWLEHCFSSFVAFLRYSGHRSRSSSLHTLDLKEELDSQVRLPLS